MGSLTLTGSSVAGGNSGGSGVENGGHVDIVPFFLGERMSTIQNTHISSVGFTLRFLYIGSY